MRKYCISFLVLTLLAVVSCRQEQDTRYFAPEIAFEQSAYAVKSDAGGVSVGVSLSSPAKEDMTVQVNASGTLQEGVQFKLSTHSLVFAKGTGNASLYVELMDDEIWDNESWIDLILSPGTRYTINPDEGSTARVNVSKDIVLPRFSLMSPEQTLEINPFLPEPLRFQIQAFGPTDKAMEVTLSLGDLVCGKDYLINGGSTPVVKYPEGARSASFEFKLVRMDVSGMDRHVNLAIEQQKGVYITSEPASADIHLYDPPVDFKALFKTPALQNGSGYQVRQAFKGPDGAWNGNTTVDLGVSSEGSNYLRNFRNMYDHPSFSCRANASVSQMFRLSDLFPNYVYPQPVAILDYGNDQGHREFSPADSLLRFVMDKGETAKGSIHLVRPKTFVAVIGSYSEWQKDITGGKTWVVDSRANNGDILASTNPAITGRISVTVHKVEGRFDFTDADAPVVLAAWLSSDSDQFLQGIDATKIAATADGGLWKIEYKLWPR